MNDPVQIDESAPPHQRARRGVAPEVLRALAVLRKAGFSILSPASLRWLTVKEVAAHLSVSPITVRRLIERGDLAPVLRFGVDEIRISERALQLWCESHCQERQSTDG